MSRRSINLLELIDRHACQCYSTFFKILCFFVALGDKTYNAIVTKLIRPSGI